MNTTREEKTKTCELCGFSFNEMVMHECDPAVLANRAEQAFEEWRRSELDQLEADEMYLRYF